MIPVHRDKVEVYITHKETIHAALGWKWWGDMHEVHEAERKERAKGFFNRLENQGSLCMAYTSSSTSPRTKPQTRRTLGTHLCSHQFN